MSGWNRGLTKEDHPGIKAQADKVRGLKGRFGIYPRTEKHRKTLSESLSGERNPMYGKKQTPETREKIRQKALKRIQNMTPEERKALFANMGYSLHRTDEYRAKLSKGVRRAIAEGKILSSERNKKISQNKGWQKGLVLMFKANGRKPTQTELKVQQILDKYFPAFKYNGNFDLGIMLGGMIPDFVNINGHKQVIEVFGDYWHSDKVIKDWKGSELGKIMAYKPFGYNCLVLWQNDVNSKSEKELCDTIRKFVTRG